MKAERFFALLIAGTSLLTVLASCDSGKTEITETPEDTPAVETNATETTTAETTAAEATTAEETSAPMSEDEQYYRSNSYAVGKLSDELLSSVNQGVLALLSDCMYFEDKLQEGIAKGQKWVYSNSSTYVPQGGSFDAMLSSGKCGANCAMPQAWFFIDAGVLKTGSHLYGSGTGTIANFDTLGKYVSAVATVTSWEGKYTFKQMYEQGLIEAGDIFYVKGHTFLYLGDEKFMAAGHDSKWHEDLTANTEDTKKAVFNTWVVDMKSCKDYTQYPIYWLVRLKDEYVPHYYRAASGRIAVNPCYDAATSIEYKEGVSSGTAEVSYANEKLIVYDTSGKTDVLQGIKVTTASCFNIASISNAVNMTDGKLYYDGVADSYADIKISDGNAYCVNPTYWYDANGEKSDVKDATHKYLCGIKFTLSETVTVDSFSYYGQAAASGTSKPFGDIDGFDILVSTDGKNWTVAYSIENATCEDKWILTTEEGNKNDAGYQMCHYIREDFNGAYEAKYVMFAMTQPRTQTSGKAQGTAYSVASNAAHWFRIAELQVYKKQ